MVNLRARKVAKRGALLASLVGGEGCRRAVIRCHMAVGFPWALDSGLRIGSARRGTSAGRRANGKMLDITFPGELLY